MTSLRLRENFSTSQVIRKTVCQPSGGIVAAQHRVAAEVGARVLAEGGNAIDYNMRSSKSLDPADYPLSGGTASDLFPWPEVAGEKNVHGPGSIDPPPLPRTLFKG